MKRIMIVAIAVSFFTMTGCVTAGEKTPAQTPTPAEGMSVAEQAVIQNRIEKLTSEIKTATDALMETEKGKAFASSQKDLEAATKRYNAARAAAIKTAEGQALVKLTGELNYWKGMVYK